jgi:hypothetical protein
MMAKMFYTLDETRAALGKNEEDIKQLTREGRLREFRDGPRLMFKADQVEQLKSELGGAGLDQVDLGSSSESGAPIGLVDSRGASGSGVGIALSDQDVPGMSGSGMQMQMKDDTAFASAAELGLSGTGGGMPSPRSGGTGIGGTMSGTGLSGTATGRGGVNVFTADDSVEHADPAAQTAITPMGDAVNLEGVGSGSGLLDLTRESDDTSLGAELLDEFAPGAAKKGGRRVSDSGISAGQVDEGRGRVITPPVQFAEAPDPMAPAFAGAAFGAAIFALVGCLVVACATLGTRPSVVDMIAGKPGDNRPLWMIAAFGLVPAVLFGIIGLVAGKSVRR